MGDHSLHLYPPSVHEQDLSPDALSEVDDACNEILAATKGWGTDEKKLIKALASQSVDARTKISIRYEELHGKNLKKLMKSECGSRDFGTCLQLLAVPPDVAECDMIRMACKGLGTNEKLLYPIICGRSNVEINLLKKKYFELYDKDLGRVLDSELGGNFEKIIFTCLQGIEEDFDPEYHTDDKMDEDVDKLYAMGQGKWGTDETGLFKIIVASPPKYLQKLNYAYADKHGVTLFKVLEDELGGDVEKATLFMLGMKLKPYETVAKLILEACKGFGTNELLLTCTLVRYQHVLKEVAAAYVEMEGESLQDRVKSETAGDYEKVLVELCNSSAF